MAEGINWVTKLLTICLLRALAIKISISTTQKRPYNKVVTAKIFSYILHSRYSELLLIIAHCSMKVNTKINFLFPTPKSLFSSVTSLFSLLSHFSLLSFSSFFFSYQSHFSLFLSPAFFLSLSSFTQEENLEILGYSLSKNQKKWSLGLSKIERNVVWVRAWDQR